jgi:hypothetical protein
LVLPPNEGEGHVHSNAEFGGPATHLRTPSADVSPRVRAKIGRELKYPRLMGL